MSKKVEGTNVHTLNKIQKTLATIRIKHPNWVKGHNEIERAHQSGHDGGDPSSVLIVGDSGAGKTSLLDSYQANFPNLEREDKTQIRILRIDAPAKPTEMTLSQAMLIALGDPFSKAKDTATEKTNRVIHLLNRAGVELIMLDEFQHVLNSPREELESITWIKTLMNRTKKPFVIAGLPSCRELVHRHTQLRKRLSGQVMLSPFSLVTQKTRSMFATVMDKLADCLPFEEKPELDQNQLLNRLHFATAGLFGYMKKLLTRARDVTIERGGNAITLADWEEAFRREIWFDAPNRLNPFSTEFCFRPLNRTGEPFDGLWPFLEDGKKAA